MALTVNTNIASLTAQRNLTGSQTELSTSLERLSSGLRINSAKDDAAGLAISERFTAQIKGLNQGARNANDGISLAQTAEGALKEVTNNLQRIRELAVQSANATNSTSDRTALQAEVTALVSEIDRVAEKASFNGIKLLDGTFTSKAFQVGANNGDTISISSINSARTSSMGAYNNASVTSGAISAAIAGTGDLTINSVDVKASVTDGVSTASATQSAKAVATAINESGTGVTATASTAVAGAAGQAASGTDEEMSLVINGVTIDLHSDRETSRALIAAAINTVSGSTGVVASDGGSDAGGVILTASDGRNIVTTFTADAGSATMADFGLGGAATTAGKVTLSSDTDIVVGDTYGGFSAATTTASVVAGTSIATATVDSVTNANAAILAVDAALATVNSTRATLGATQSRFDSVVASVQTTAENLSASRSRIQDADFASETANLTKQQILQQSGIAMLAQANSIPQNVLALLQ
jgi:flagellin|tara:strand:+ start:534 stop:1952 length:1419 start_codon:yes stop_codon:yes gene_type:complete